MNVAPMIWVHDSSGSGLRDAEQARVSVLDHGFTVADAVFETLKISAGQPFALTRHLSRLQRSALALGLAPPDIEAIDAAVYDTVAANAAYLGAVGRLRVTYTGGAGPLGSQRDESAPTWVIATAPTTPWAPTARLATVPWPKNERGPLTGIKSTSYADNVMALAFAHEAGADEALWLNTQGSVCEGSGSNVFMVADGVISTPPLSAGCLPGITRELVVEWAQVTQNDMSLAQLQAADEVFITSSTRDVQPVSAVDGIEYPAPGPITGRLIEIFTQNASRLVDP